MPVYSHHPSQHPTILFSLSSILRVSDPNGRPGFSLVEILLTLFIATVLITIVLAVSGSQLTRHKSDLQAIAVKIASKDIETLRQTNFSSLPADSGTTCLQDYASDLAKLPNACHTRNLSNYYGDSDIKQITVTITWHESNQPQCAITLCKVQLNTLIYKNGL